MAVEDLLSLRDPDTFPFERIRHAALIAEMCLGYPIVHPARAQKANDHHETLKPT